MSPYSNAKSKHRLSLKSFIFILIFIYSCQAGAQSPVNFSGVWTQDNEKSDDFYKSFDVKVTITQTAQVISLKQTFFDKSGKEIISRESTYNLDGKEVIKEEQGGINKESAAWSPDKKTLTTKSTRTVGSDVYGSSTAFTLSADGRVLTFVTSDINPLGPSVKQVFNKGQ